MCTTLMVSDRSEKGRRITLLLTLLLLLLHGLDYLPDQVSSLTLHPDGVGLLGVVELEHILNAPDLAQGASQHLCRAQLLLASLLLLTLGLLLLVLLLIALRHLVLLTSRCLHHPEGLHPLPATPRLYPVCLEVRHGDYLLGCEVKFIYEAGGA